MQESFESIIVDARSCTGENFYFGKPSTIIFSQWN